MIEGNDDSLLSALIDELNATSDADKTALSDTFIDRKKPVFIESNEPLDVPLWVSRPSKPE